jgi:uncharacterized membrane protein
MVSVLAPAGLESAMADILLRQTTTLGVRVHRLADRPAAKREMRSVETAYGAWTQFETFPAFMADVEDVRQIDDRYLYWRVNVVGKEEAFTAEITEQIPEKRIAWTSKVTSSGAANAGVVTFHRLDDAHARVMLQLGYEPQGIAEKVGNALGILNANVQSDLKRFKKFVERFGDDIEGWRGEIPSRADVP